MSRTQRPSPRSKHTRPRPATPVASPPQSATPPIDHRILVTLDRALTALREECARTMALARLTVRAIRSIEATHEQAERAYLDARRVQSRVRRMLRNAR